MESFGCGWYRTYCRECCLIEKLRGPWSGFVSTSGVDMDELQFKQALEESLIKVADVLMEYYNPCHRSLNKCLVELPHGCPNSEGTCSRCDFLVGSECGKVNLNCKLWFCITAIMENKECAEDFRILESLAIRYGLVRRPYLGQRYVGMSAELALLKESNGG